MTPLALVRRERPNDQPAVRYVNEAAFGRPDEADLIERLRLEGVVLLSLVAEIEAQVVGHILFSRMWIETGADPVPAVSLAPLAVLRGRRRMGVGGRLVRSGLELLREQGEQIVIVLGHPDYYSRFGFSCEKARRLESPFPRDSFMALELRPSALKGVQGRVKYPAAFGL